MTKKIFLFSIAFLLFSSCAHQGDFYGMKKPGGAEGVLTDEAGHPIEGAEVYFYLDPERKFRGPADFMAEPTGPDGKYYTELPPGKYYAVARKRASGSISGSLQKGDLYTLNAELVEVKEGKFERIDLTLSPLSGNMLLNVFAGQAGRQGISGVIKDRDGNPVKQAYAFAYKDARMAGKPDFVSGWTRDDGAFVIYTDGAGKYYIGARTGFMGVPKPDEPYGKYAGSPDHSVSVKDGELSGGIVITLGRFSDTR